MNSLLGKTAALLSAYAGKFDSKAKSRSLKRSRKTAAERKALPKLHSNKIPANYKNPVTLSPVRGVVYRVTNRGTGRKNYYTKAILEKLIGRKMSNYALLMASPKTALFRNPATRGSVYPRNIMRVKV
jgi:hypothetical protein